MQPSFRRARAAAPAHASGRGGPSGALARQVFLDLDFTLLEMNPFTLDAAGKPFPLDMRGELDDTAAFKSGKKCARGLPPARSSHGGRMRLGHGAARGLGANTAGRSSGSRVPQCASRGLHLSTRLSLCAPAARPGGGWALVSSYGPGVLGRCPAVKESDWACRWGDVEFPLPFGRALTAAEEHIARLDASTGASLKLSILNLKGRVWTMVAGGGASVIYADTVGDLGFAGELGNYAEYSGAPNTQVRTRGGRRGAGDLARCVHTRLPRLCWQGFHRLVAEGHPRVPMEEDFFFAALPCVCGQAGIREAPGYWARHGPGMNLTPGQEASAGAVALPHPHAATPQRGHRSLAARLTASPPRRRRMRMPRRCWTWRPPARTAAVARSSSAAASPTSPTWPPRSRASSRYALGTRVAVVSVPEQQLQSAARHAPCCMAREGLQVGEWHCRALWPGF